MPRNRSRNRSRSRPRQTNNNSLQAQVTRLEQAMSRLTAAPRRQRSRSRQPSRQVMAPSSMTFVESRGRGRSNTPVRNRLTNNLGRLQFSHRELFTSVVLSKNKSAWSSYAPIDAKSFGFLKKMGALFGRYRFKYVGFEYQSLCPSTTPGVVIYGIDWGCTTGDASETLITPEKIVTFNPSVSHAPWVCDVKLPPLPRDRLNARTWYDCDGAGNLPITDTTLATLAIYFSTTNSTTSDTQLGHLWISYTVEFEGPTI